jgi:hypothetical protein
LSPAETGEVPPPSESGRAASATLSSLRKLALLCVLLPLLAYAGVGLYRYQQIESETELRLSRSLGIATEHALKVLDTSETQLARMLDALGADEPAAIAGRELALHRQLQAIAGDKPQIQGLWVMDERGLPLATSRHSPVPPGVDISARDDFRWHAGKDRGVAVSAPQLSPVAKDRIIDISRGRYAADGRFLCVVRFGLSSCFFE